MFVTVGNHNDPFVRPLQWADDLVGRGVVEPPVLLQRGHTPFTAAHCDVVDFLPVERFWNIVRESRIIVTHGGNGSVVAALKSGRVPIVVPRERAYGEHLNDHQVRFAQALEAQGLVRVARAKDAFERHVVELPRGAEPPKARYSADRVVGLVADFVREVERGATE